MRRCQLNTIGIRRACLVQETARPITSRREFHATRSQCEDETSSTPAEPRSKRASSAAAVRDLLNLPKATESSRYFRKEVVDVSSDAPRQVVFRGRGGAGTGMTRSAGRGGMSGFGRGGGAQGGAAGGMQGRGRGGGAQGGAAGGMQGRGRGGKAGGPQRRAPNAAQTQEDDEDGEFEEDPMDMAPEHLLEEHAAFENEPEAESYIALMELVEGAEARYTEAQELAAKGSKSNDKEMSREAERATQRVDEDIRAGLAQLQATQDMVRPRHTPQDVTLSHFAREAGYVPVGAGGMGHVVEDGLRLLAKRVGHEWEHPRALAQRLIAGEFVKFRNLPEKRDVIRMAGELGLEGSEGAKVKFTPLDESARKTIVERLVRGRNGDTADSELKSAVLKNIARLTNGNPTIPGHAKNTLLKTVQNLLPPERPSQGQRAPRNT